MLARLFFGFLAIVILFLGYELYSLHSKKTAPFHAPPEKIYAPEGADLTVVEFVDYGCPDCRLMHPVFMQAVKEDGKVSVIPRPVFSTVEDARSAAYMVEASAGQGKYVELHNYFLENLPTLQSKEDVLSVSGTLGLDGEKLYDDVQKESTLKMIKANQQMMVNLNLRATPSFLIGPDLSVIPPETATVEDFKNWFNDARAHR